MKRQLISLGLLVSAALAPAYAGTLTYSDSATWSAAVTNITNFDGGAQNVGGFSTFNTSAGLALTDLQIVGFNITTGITYDLTRYNASTSQPWYQWNTGSILRSGDKTDTNNVYLHVQFTNPVNAFGFNFGAGGLSGAPGSVTVATNGLSAVTVNTLQQPNFAFYGVTSDTQTFSYADIYINDTGRYLVLDNVSYGSFSAPVEPPPPSETPEPGTFVQLLMGSGLVAFARRRFQPRES